MDPKMVDPSHKFEEEITSMTSMEKGADQVTYIML
jgi:hypothetical protein